MGINNINNMAPKKAGGAKKAKNPLIN